MMAPNTKEVEMYKHAAIFAMLAASCSAYASEIGVNLLSIHDEPGYRTVTPGVYFVSDDGWTAGLLQNSEGRSGSYVGKTFKDSDGLFALTVGGITGYKAKVTPLVVPSVRLYSADSFEVRTTLLPKVPKTDGCNAIHISVEFRI